MLIKPGEHAHLAQLLRFMELGEQLAHDCAQTQCALVPERGMQTFLAGQARQEKSRRYLDIYIEQATQLMSQIHQNIGDVERNIFYCQLIF